MTDGTDKVIKLAKKYKVKTAWGTDTLFDPELAKKQGKLIAKLKRWYTPYEALKMVTHDNAQLLKMSGPRDPYPGELGVVKEGALADLIIVDGNPLENLYLVAEPDKNFVVRSDHEGREDLQKCAAIILLCRKQSVADAQHHVLSRRDPKVATRNID